MISYTCNSLKCLLGSIIRVALWQLPNQDVKYDQNLFPLSKIIEVLKSCENVFRNQHKEHGTLF